jgi:uncharacterized protein (TIGR02246 family)
MDKSPAGVIQVADAEKFRDTFQDLFHAGDLDGLVSLFEPDGAFVSGPGQVAVGPDAIRKVLAGFLAGLRQSLVIMAGCCGDTPGLAFSRPGW